MSDHTPVLLGERFRLVERLGAGGMAVVWRAYDEVLHRRVAIKVVSPGLASQERFLRLLRVEARAAAGLSHPNITSVYDYGEEQTEEGIRPYVVMELVDGATLASVLAEHPSGLPWRTAVAIAAQVSSGLAAAHARGIVHRDISSSNVMLAPDGVRILDFGISAVAGARDGGDELVGTPDFVSPERIAGDDVAPAADVYAVGVLLYRCLAGEMPWGPGTETQRLRDHLYRPPSDLPPIEGLPPEIAEVCLRCLAKRPEDRPSSAELAARLSAPAIAMPGAAAVAVAVAVAEEHTQVLQISTSRLDQVPVSRETVLLPWSRRRAVVLGAAGALVAAAAAAWALTTHSAPAAKAQAVPSGQAQNACVVTYVQQLREDRRFGASVTVQSSQARPASAWRLTFVLAGDQRITGQAPARISQQDRQVAVTSPTPLDSGRPVSLRLVGDYRTAAEAPQGFALDGQACQAVVNASSPSPADDEASGGLGSKGKGKGKGKG